MSINFNPVNWNLRKFLIFTFCLTVSTAGFLGLDSINMHLPLIRQVIFFLYLTIVPGTLILRIFNFNKLELVESLLYTVGLSLSFSMFIGVTLNYLGPSLGISEPISTRILISTFLLFNSSLMIICFFKCQSTVVVSSSYENSFPKNKFLFLILIPFLTVFGTYLINYYNNTILLMIVILIISIITISVGFNFFKSHKEYAFLVFVIAISLLFHQTLISMYISGYDIQHEYFISNKVIKNCLWDSSFYYNTNGMLSIVMLVPIFSKMCDMSPIWVFKILYQLIFSLVPLALYYVFKKQTDEKIAFAACFFFMSSYTFFAELPTLGRQQIAELFLSLLLLTFVSESISGFQRKFLQIVFGLSIVVSHYGLTYIFLFSIIALKFIFFVLNNRSFQQFMIYITRIHPEKSTDRFRNRVEHFNFNDSRISSNFVSLFIVFALIWYLHTTDSSLFKSIVSIVDNIVNNFFSDFANPETAQGLAVMTIKTTTLLQHIHKIINYLNQFFIVIGVLNISIATDKYSFSKEFRIFSVIYLGLLVGSIVLPNFAISFQISRLYHISMFFLAPFIVIGILTVPQKLCAAVGFVWNKQKLDTIMLLAFIYLVIFFLFQIGLIFQVSYGSSSSIAFNTEGDLPKFSEKEITSAYWLYHVSNSTDPIYSDVHRWLMLKGIDWMRNIQLGSIDATTEKKTYIYFGEINIRDGKFMILKGEGANRVRTHINANQLIVHKNKIYNNGGSQIFI